MRRLRFAALALLLGSTASWAGTTITFGPGPYGSTRINTPWGVYVATDLPDGVWVGTEEELQNAIAHDVFTRDGDEQVHLAGHSRSEQIYVTRGTEITIGGSRLYDIEPELLFGVKPNKAFKRMPHPPGTEYIGIVWIGQLRQPVQANLLINGARISPYICGQHDEFRDCEFIVRRQEIGMPAKVVFLLPGNKPAMAEFPSLALKAYQDIKQNNKGMDLGKEELADLRALHDIDPEIPLTIETN